LLVVVYSTPADKMIPEGGGPTLVLNTGLCSTPHRPDAFQPLDQILVARRVARAVVIMFKVLEPPTHRARMIAMTRH